MKAKGVQKADDSKLSKEEKKKLQDEAFNEHTQLLEGVVLSKDVLQFKSGKALYMMDQEIEGRVKVVTTQKKMSQFDKEGKQKYSKGVIQGQTVLPFMFENGVNVTHC